MGPFKAKLCLVLILCWGAAHASAQQATSIPLSTPDIDDIEYPDDEPPSSEEVELGKILFFDPRLSANDKQSCATCHNPDLGFGDGLALGKGTMGGTLDRNTPHLYNLAFSSVLMWDGRNSTLEEQVLGPLESPKEMNISIEDLLPKLQKVSFYANAFQRIYGSSSITKENFVRAIAAFERSLISLDSPFDRFLRGEKSALSPAAIRGLELFENKARCTKCHDGANFTDDSFHNIGVDGNDPGRQVISPGEGMTGAFKTPGLRNSLYTAPYMHNGSIASLEDVVKFYNKDLTQKENIDPLIQPLNLSDSEIGDLVAFLGALSDPIHIERPQIPK